MTRYVKLINDQAAQNRFLDRKNLSTTQLKQLEAVEERANTYAKEWAVKNAYIEHQKQHSKAAEESLAAKRTADAEEQAQLAVEEEQKRVEDEAAAKAAEAEQAEQARAEAEAEAGKQAAEEDARQGQETAAQDQEGGGSSSEEEDAGDSNQAVADVAAIAAQQAVERTTKTLESEVTYLPEGVCPRYRVLLVARLTVLPCLGFVRWSSFGNTKRQWCAWLHKGIMDSRQRSTARLNFALRRWR